MRLYIYTHIYIQCTSMFLGWKSCEFLEEHLLAIPNVKIIIPELCRRRRSVSLQKACPTAAALLRPEIFDQVCAICLVLTWTCQRNPYTVTDRSVATKINDEHIYIYNLTKRINKNYALNWWQFARQTNKVFATPVGRWQQYRLCEGRHPKCGKGQCSSSCVRTLLSERIPALSVKPWFLSFVVAMMPLRPSLVLAPCGV
jgi:hypothetical protein